MLESGAFQCLFLEGWRDHAQDPVTRGVSLDHTENLVHEPANRAVTSGYSSNKRWAIAPEQSSAL